MIVDLSLTPREGEVVALVKRGYSSKRIAREMGISPITVRNHINNVASRIEDDIPARRKLMLLDGSSAPRSNVP